MRLCSSGSLFLLSVVIVGVFAAVNPDPAEFLQRLYIKSDHGSITTEPIRTEHLNGTELKQLIIREYSRARFPGEPEQRVEDYSIFFNLYPIGGDDWRLSEDLKRMRLAPILIRKNPSSSTSSSSTSPSQTSRPAPQQHTSWHSNFNHKALPVAANPSYEGRFPRGHPNYQGEDFLM